MPKKSSRGKPTRKAATAKKVARKGTKTRPIVKKPVKRKETPRKQASSAEPLPKVGDWVRPNTAAKYWGERIGQILSVTGKGAEATALVRFHFLYTTGAKVKPEQWAFPLSRTVLVHDFAAIAQVAEKAKPAPVKHTYDFEPEDHYEEVN